MDDDEELRREFEREMASGEEEEEEGGGGGVEWEEDGGGFDEEQVAFSDEGDFLEIVAVRKMCCTLTKRENLHFCDLNIQQIVHKVDTFVC